LKHLLTVSRDFCWIGYSNQQKYRFEVPECPPKNARNGQKIRLKTLCY